MGRASRGDQLRAVWRIQSQGRRQQIDCVQSGCPANAPFQILNATDAQARLLGQGLLREAGYLAVVLEE